MLRRINLVHRHLVHVNVDLRKYYCTVIEKVDFYGVQVNKITNFPSAFSYRSAKRRSTGVRTDGNIARLSADDDDDENNTWNGNSTQQM